MKKLLWNLEVFGFNVQFYKILTLGILIYQSVFSQFKVKVLVLQILTSFEEKEKIKDKKKIIETL